MRATPMMYVTTAIEVAWVVLCLSLTFAFRGQRAARKAFIRFCARARRQCRDARRQLDDARLRLAVAQIERDKELQGGARH